MSQILPQSLISIIVPVYNTARFLPRCLESLIGQTYTNLEIICVDDGSTDDSLAVLAQYAARDARLKVIHQENAGAAAARNRGIDVAMGRFVTFVDSDDWLEPDAYAKTVPHMVDGADLVWFGVSVDGDMEPGYREVLERHFHVSKPGRLQCTPWLLRSIGGEMGNKIYRKSLIKEYDMRFLEGLQYGEDKSFSYSYLCVTGTVQCVSELLYHYCIHGESAMSRYDSRKDKGEMARRLYDWVAGFVKKYHRQSRSTKALLALLYEEYMVCALPGASAELRLSIYREGKKAGYLALCHDPAVLALRQQFMPPWERLVHGFVQNREFFGIGKLHFWSITYEFRSRVHRCLGCRVLVVNNK